MISWHFFFKSIKTTIAHGYKNMCPSITHSTIPQNHAIFTCALLHHILIKMQIKYLSSLETSRTFINPLYAGIQNGLLDTVICRIQKNIKFGNILFNPLNAG